MLIIDNIRDVFFRGTIADRIWLTLFSVSGICLIVLLVYRIAAAVISDDGAFAIFVGTIGGLVGFLFVLLFHSLKSYGEFRW